MVLMVLYQLLFVWCLMWLPSCSAFVAVYYRCLKSLSPTYMVECSEASELMFEKLLTKLVEYKKNKPSVADQAKFEFSRFMSTLVKENGWVHSISRRNWSTGWVFLEIHKIKISAQIPKKIIPNCSGPFTWATTSWTKSLSFAAEKKISLVDIKATISMVNAMKRAASEKQKMLEKLQNKKKRIMKWNPSYK